MKGGAMGAPDIKDRSPPHFYGLRGVPLPVQASILAYCWQHPFGKQQRAIGPRCIRKID